MRSYKHKTPVQLRFKDGDVMGHVNNANHFTFFELARVHYFRDVVGKDINWNKDGIILAKIIIDYKSPLLITATTYAYTRCARLGTKSFDLEYLLVIQNNVDIGTNEKSDEVTTLENETVIATGISTLVCYNYEINESVNIPEEWRNKMSAFDGIA